MRSRLIVAGVSLLGTAGAIVTVTTTGITGAAQSIFRPVAGLSAPHLDYDVVPVEANGAAARLDPLEHGVINASLADFTELRYQQHSDLGGFAPAPIGHLIDNVAGRAVATGPNKAEIPLFAETGGTRANTIQSFAFVSGSLLRRPPPPTFPSVVVPTTTVPARGSTRTVPLVTSFLGGAGTGPPAETTTTTPNGTGTGPSTSTSTSIPITRRRTTTSSSTTSTVSSVTTTTTRTRSGATTTTSALPKSTTTTAPPRSTTTTAPPGTTTTTTPPPSCLPSADDVKMANDHNCEAIITETNRAPGDSVTKNVTITNVGSASFTLVLQVSATVSPALSPYLSLVVAKHGSGYDLNCSASETGRYYCGAVQTGETEITSIAPGQSVELDVVIALSSAAGNEVQNTSATFDLDWGTGT